MTIDSLMEQRRPRRPVQGVAALLLPYLGNGQVAVDAFQRQAQHVHQVRLMNAVNMDTGYVNYLSDAEKVEVLRWTHEALGKKVPFVAGAYIEGQEGDAVSLYRRQMDSIFSFGGIPIIFQTARLHGKPGKEKI